MRGRNHRRALIGSSAAALVLAAGAAEAAGPYFERLATLPVYRNLPEGVDPASETAAEIVAATPDGTTVVYTDSPQERIGLIDITDPTAPAPVGTIALDGEPTSVTVVGDHALVGVNTSASYTEPGGHVAVIGLATGETVARCDVGGQPDSVAASPDGRYLAVAIENERDEELNDGVIPQAPPGHLAVLDLDGAGLPANCEDVRIVDLTGLAEVAPGDPEPEFVDVNTAGIAAVTLQENNHVALVDLASGEVTGDFSTGTADLEAIDTVEDGIVAASGSLSDVRREPDAIAWLDESRLVTANEGDYEGGSRGFTVFDTSGEVLYESGNALEHLGMRIGHYPEHRAENKGVEPEGVEVGRFGERTLLIVNSERGNFLAIYEARAEGAEPAFVQALPTALGPEGVVAVPARDLLVVASEEDDEDEGYRGTIAVYGLGADTAPYPTLVSTEDAATGAPIGWGALSGLAADPADPDTLYAVSDSAYAVSRVYTIDTAATPPTITAYVDLVKDGEPAAYDLEGVALRDGGGFWLASEGNPENENPLTQRSLLLSVAADGTVEDEIALPDALYEHATNRGFEGVAAWGAGADERVILALQKGWQDDPEDTTKLALFEPQNDAWRFVRYPLEAPKSPRGGWVGLSEITWLGDQRFAVLERDNQPGAYAEIKTITVIDLAGVEPAPYGEELPMVEKTRAIDLLPELRASRGWISDKPEGFAVTADDEVFVLTDNDGVDEASGETQLLKLGRRGDLF